MKPGRRHGPQAVRILDARVARHVAAGTLLALAVLVAPVTATPDRLAGRGSPGAGAGRRR